MTTTTSHPSRRLRRFALGARVLVVEAVHASDPDKTITVNAVGVVTRLRTADDAAWIELEERSRMNVHPFPEGDERERKIVTWPEGCEPVPRTRAKNRKQRRKGMRSEVEAAEPTPTIASFGCDHWSTFGYVETRIVDHGGELDRRHMRCSDARHPHFSHGHDAQGYPTRMRGEAVLTNHDDWDCVDDCVREGLLENVGASIYPVYRLTPKGLKVASDLRAHKAKEESFGTFTPSKEHLPE
jgi:hypothetical protein